MHTSAPSAYNAQDMRLFEDVPLQYSGTLLHPAQVRATVLDRDGHTVPVLCFDIELDCPMRNHMHVEKPFPVGHHAQAAAEAHRLRKGTHVQVDAPVIGLRLVAANATHIHVLPTTPAASNPAAATPQEPAAPCPK